MGAGEPLFILHGLFGSSDNWQTLARQYAETHEVYLIDQRNHGHSFHSTDFSYEIMADDVAAIVKEEGLSKVNFISHSMGGKTVMTFAQNYPEHTGKIIVADMGIKEYPPHHDAILAALNSVDLSVVKSRKEVDEQLGKHIDNFGVKQFLLKNLYWESEGQLGWRINIPVLSEKMPEILRPQPRNIAACEAKFIIGEKSNYVVPSDYEDIKGVFPNVSFEVIPGVGHWLHAENPKAFFASSIEFLSQ